MNLFSYIALVKTVKLLSCSSAHRQLFAILMGCFNIQQNCFGTHHVSGVCSFTPAYCMSLVLQTKKTDFFMHDVIYEASSWCPWWRLKRRKLSDRTFLNTCDMGETFQKQFTMMSIKSCLCEFLMCGWNLVANNIKPPLCSLVRQNTLYDTRDFNSFIYASTP